MMMLLHIRRFVMIVTMTTLATVCVAKKKEPIFVDSGFQFQEVDDIYILPAVDLTVNKDKDPEKLLQQVDCVAPYYLKRRGYDTVPKKLKCKQEVPPVRMNLTEDELKEPQESWKKTLGPDGARWIFVLALEERFISLNLWQHGQSDSNGHTI